MGGGGTELDRGLTHDACLLPQYKKKHEFMRQYGDIRDGGRDKCLCVAVMNTGSDE